MRHESKSVIVGILSAIGIVIIVAFAGRTFASGGPSAANYASLKQIKQNQEVIAKNREAYKTFMAAKADNEKQIQLLGKDGYTLDWSKMSLIPYSF